VGEIRGFKNQSACLQWEVRDVSLHDGIRHSDKECDSTNTFVQTMQLPSQQDNVESINKYPIFQKLMHERHDER